MTVDQYRVVGNPVAHSLSPRIHSLFAAQTGQDLAYEILQAPVNDFAGTVEQFFADPSARGVNVTVPFKQDACHWVDTLDASAQRAQAVNTILRTQDGFLGCNTDGVGLVADCERLLPDLAQRNVLMLGAGGAVRGVLGPLLDAGVAQIVVVNRSEDKARALADEFADRRISANDSELGMDEALLSSELLVINGTSASLSGAVPEFVDALFDRLQGRGNLAAYDMAYGADGTVFTKRAEQAGFTVVADGLGMLVEQAAAAFALWRGVQPETEPVLSALRQQLALSARQ